MDYMCDPGGTTDVLGVPVLPDLVAYVAPLQDGVIDERMVICDKYQQSLMDSDIIRAQQGLSIMDQHVPLRSSTGNAVTQRLLNAGWTLNNLADSWLAYFIHEISHAEAFTGRGNRLGKCNDYVTILAPTPTKNDSKL